MDQGSRNNRGGKPKEKNQEGTGEGREGSKSSRRVEESRNKDAKR